VTPTFRLGTVDDVAAIADIEAVVFSDPWSADSFVSMVHAPNAELTVAAEGGRVLGYSVLLLAPPDADLANLAVVSYARRQGIGRRLLDHAVQVARDAGVIHMYLEVRQSNTRAIAMYERAGFRDFGTRKRYYRDPVEDARVMRLDL